MKNLVNTHFGNMSLLAARSTYSLFAVSAVAAVVFVANLFLATPGHGGAFLATEEAGITYLVSCFIMAGASAFAFGIIQISQNRREWEQGKISVAE